MKNLIINVICDCGEEVTEKESRQLLKDMIKADIICEIAPNVFEEMRLAGSER